MSKRLLVNCLSRDVLLDVAGSLELDIASRASAGDVRARLLAHLEGDAQDGDDAGEDAEAASEPGEGDSGDEPEAAPAYRGPEYEDRFWQELAFRPDASPARDYQTQAVQAALHHLSPQRPCLIHVATGGGKTRIGNDAVVARLGFEQGWALWVTKDWRLLRQAARPARDGAPLAHYTRGPRLVRPDYDPKGEPRWLDDSEAVPEVMRGLWYRHGQTFGVEFELTRDDHADPACRAPGPPG